MEHPCWVLACPYPASMKVHVSAIMFPGERFRLVPVCDHHGRHVEGRGLPLALVPAPAPAAAAAAPGPDPEPAAAAAPEARPVPLKRVSRR